MDRGQQKSPAKKQSKAHVPTCPSNSSGSKRHKRAKSEMLESTLSSMSQPDNFTFGKKHKFRPRQATEILVPKSPIRKSPKNIKVRESPYSQKAIAEQRRKSAQKLRVTKGPIQPYSKSRSPSARTPRVAAADIILMKNRAV